MRLIQLMTVKKNRHKLGQENKMWITSRKDLVEYKEGKKIIAKTKMFIKKKMKDKDK